MCLKRLSARCASQFAGMIFQTRSSLFKMSAQRAGILELSGGESCRQDSFYFRFLQAAARLCGK
ncbi:MAG: DUF6783 domain-containing protein [Ruminococcus sp.]